MSDLTDYPLLQAEVGQHLDDNPTHATVEIRAWTGDLVTVLCDCGHSFPGHIAPRNRT